MRTFLILCAIIISQQILWGENAYGQSLKENNINYAVKGVSVGEAFNELSKLTGFYFFYDESTLRDIQQVNLQVRDGSIDSILNELSQQTGLNFKKINNTISVSKNKTTVIIPGTPQQREMLTGTVTDRDGESVIGANIRVKGASLGTITDIDGRFSLDAPEEGTLVISYIGYLTKEIPLGRERNIAVTLIDDMQRLDEVVVVGYGTQKKVNLTGAVVSVKSDVIEDRPIKTAVDALQGTLPGVTVTSSTGQPGTFSKIKVRGETSINSAGALVLIDGMPGDINTVNPMDIEDISILKDAASSAIYGARAAEGVVLITTKQGTSQKTKIEYSGNLSFNKPTRLPKSNNALDHALLSNTSFSNAGLGVMFPEEAIEAIKDPNITAIPKGNDWIYTADVDWIDMMIRHSYQQNHNLTISKASEGLKYLFSFGWLDQDGLFAKWGPDNNDRFNLRSNINVDIIKDVLNFDTRVVFNRTKARYHPIFGAETGKIEMGTEAENWSIPYIIFKQAGPNMPVYDPNGNYSRYRMQGNPIQALKEGGVAKSTLNNIDGMFTLAYKPIRELTLKAVGGFKFDSGQMKVWKREYGKYGPNGLVSMAAGQNGPNRLTQVTTNERYITGQLLGEYKKTFDRKHEVNALGGWSAETHRYDKLQAERINIIGNELPALDLGATEGWSNKAEEKEWALLSGFMRVNYAYASKYLFEANFRADGSSRFSDDNKWGFFPSVSVGWRLTEEKFMQSQDIFSNIKFRASWGQLGNQNGLGLYDHIPQYKINGYYPFDSELAQWALLDKLPSQERTWETVEMRNIAVELGFFDNRLNFTGEYFVKNNKDMLVNIELPSVIGIDVPTGNYGELEVKGWEVSLNWRDKIKEFNYFINFNLADQKDKLVDYGVEFVGFTAGVNQKVQGYSLGSIFGFQADGYFTTQEEVDASPVFNRSVTGPGDIRYVDQDGDGKISAPNDLVHLGSTMPRYEFGINMGGSWRDIDFSLLIQGVGKRDFYLTHHAVAPFADTWGNYSYTLHNDYWTPENPNALLPRHYTGTRHNYQHSSHWLQNAAYARLKNLQVGYTLKKDITKKFGAEKLRIYFSGENLFEVSKLLKDYDPELTTAHGYMYPMMRNFSFGINLTL